MENFCHNCMGSCIHAKIEEKKKKVEYKDDNGNILMFGWESSGYRHYCDKNLEGYNKWHEEHKNETYDTYKNFPMPCYEGNETSRKLEELITTTKNFLDSIKDEVDK